MKKFSLLYTAAAVATVISSASVFANSNDDIEALKLRLQELETKVNTETKYKDDQQPATLTSETKVPDGLVFSGYARYGAHYQNSDKERVSSFGSLSGNATGRLGNEGNGGEFQLAKVFKNDSGAIWDLVLMLDHWSEGSWADDGGLNVKKMYAGVANVFESQPDLYLWAGRDFHQRPQTDLNDYFWMTHDSQGAGFKNLTLGGIKFDFAGVGQVNDDMVEDNGRYALTSKLHGIKLGDVDLSLYANYGTTSEKLTEDDKKDLANSAYQLASEAVWAGQKFVIRYSHNALNSVFDLADNQDALLFSLDGAIPLTERAKIQYLTSYQKLDLDKSDESRKNYSFILRPTYQWNDVHSTWLEGGYSIVDYDDIDATNTSWKTTLSQNIAIGGETWSRPMLRFYATVGNADNEYTGRDDKGVLTTSDDDTVTFGAMFEAWW
ncbi:MULTISPECIES: carbohydrate porin [unclassified Aeromonas]|uniref:carbohydrate porin n=1 Tax=unclassified Aeromonas TaxID=257493 RepID=UPI00084AD683|nr:MULTISPECIES: carbohydrate porin [unclassified Aeromonas]OEC50598.1 lactam utilization protein LamB [Aeromonas sp. ANNP30]OEC62697.1 lactam utilization protein LamB [Aeromonas sp. ANP5]